MQVSDLAVLLQWRENKKEKGAIIYWAINILQVLWKVLYLVISLPLNMKEQMARWEQIIL